MTLLLVAAVAVAAGAAGGWFFRASSASSTATASSATAPVAAASGSATPCGQWSSAVCEGAGAESEACAQARGAASLLPDGVCASAMGELPAILAKVEQARGVCTELVTKLCNDLGPTTSTCEMVKTKTPQLRPQQCQEMMDKYGEVVGELKKIEKRNAPLSPEEVAAQTAGDGPAFGPADAKVTLVEYSDFECPYCARAATTMHALQEKYGDKVRILFRQFPLPMHKNAKLAAEASLAAHAQGKFKPFHDKLFENQRQLDRASLEKYAEELGLDMAAFKKALDDSTYAAAVDADMKLGEAIGVSGTPTLLVGKERIQNPGDVAAVSKVIDAQLAE